MASAAVEGFVTGFAGTLAQNVIENKQRARDYFDKQVEFARTTGLENRNRVRETVNTNISIARQLEAVGVPKEVIMAQVNQDPAGLSSFYEQAEKIRASTGKDFTPEEWKAIFKVAGDFKAPDEDIATFISRTYDPIANAAAEPDFADDPEGTLISRMMGFNAMDQARARLGETVVADGMTADQLIRYGDVQPQRVGGNAVVTTNYSAIPGRKGGSSDLSISETSALLKVVDEQVNTAIGMLESAGGLAEGADITATRDEVVREVSTLYPQASPTDIQRMADNAIRKRRYTVDTGVEAPVEAPVGETSPEAEMPSEAPPTASVTPDVITTGDGIQLTLVRDNDDGTSTYMDPDGNEYRIATELARQQQ